jgi:hypothetical protein
MLNRFFSFFVLVVFMFGYVVPVYAADPVVDPASLPPVTMVAGEVPVGNVISPMKLGQKAMFSGLLLSPSAVATVISNLDHQKQACDIEVKKATDTDTAQCTLKVTIADNATVRVQSVSDAEVKSRDAQIKTLSDALQKAQSSSSSPYIWAVVGVVSGIALTLGTVFLVSKAL